MRVAVITSPGGQDNLVIEERPDPRPGAGEVLVAVAYAGCNWADTMLRKGTYPHPTTYPLVPGFEVSGRVAEVGPDVQGVKEGDRVAAYVEHGGGYAERCVVGAESLTPLPDGLGLDAGAAFPIQGLTSWHMIHTIGGTKPGDTVLVHAIGGGVGLFCTQIAVHAGARVIGTVGTPGKERRALELGATRVVDRGEEDFGAVALEMTGGRGVDLVLELAGRHHARSQLRCRPAAGQGHQHRRGRRGAFQEHPRAPAAQVADLHPFPSGPRGPDLGPLAGRGRGDAGRHRRGLARGADRAGFFL